MDDRLTDEQIARMVDPSRTSIPHRLAREVQEWRGLDVSIEEVLVMAQYITDVQADKPTFVSDLVRIQTQEAEIERLRAVATAAAEMFGHFISVTRGEQVCGGCRSSLDAYQAAVRCTTESEADRG